MMTGGHVQRRAATRVAVLSVLLGLHNRGLTASEVGALARGTFPARR